MKITITDKTLTEFCMLPIGSVFRYKGCYVFMKLERIKSCIYGNECNSVELESGKIWWVDDDEKVELLEETELLIK